MSVFEKILNIQADCRYVQKTGKNTYHNYTYATEGDILRAVKDAAIKHGVAITCTTESESGHIEAGGKLVRWAKVTLKGTLTDIETAESITASFDGYAEDTGDKAIYKATTGAYKYFLLKTFGIETGDDPEMTSDLEIATQAPQKETKTLQPPPPLSNNPSGAEILKHIYYIMSVKKLDNKQTQAITGLKSTSGATKEMLLDALTKLQKV